MIVGCVQVRHGLMPQRDDPAANYNEYWAAGVPRLSIIQVEK
jgi:hypothetical protein